MKTIQLTVAMLTGAGTLPASAGASKDTIAKTDPPAAIGL